jgi:GT2 family glycosyltransferase
MNTPLITLSIVSHGDADKIARLLKSIQRHESAMCRNIQLLLTDNLRDELPDYDPSYWASYSIFRNEHPLGFAQNHNNAFKNAAGKYFLIFNPDLVFESPVINALLNSLQKHNADLIAPQIMDETGVVQDSFRTLPTPFELIRRRLPGYSFKPYQPDSDGIVHPDWIAGMFWLMPSKTYRDLGGMDEKFFLYLEDVDFCTRARLQGMKILVDSNIQIIHEARRSSRKSLKYFFLHLQSAFIFFTSDVYRRAMKNF